jgi:hypothetical protein
MYWQESCPATPRQRGLLPRPVHVQVGKSYAARCSKALNKKEAIALQEEGFERVEAIFAKGEI